MNDLLKSVDGVYYFCDKNSLQKYLRKKDGVVAFVQKGVDNNYIEVDKDKKTVVVNNNIDCDLGVSAEATRIKICAAFNTVLQTFAKTDFKISVADLGLIKSEKSALDDRKKGGVDKVSVDDLLD